MGVSSDISGATVLYGGGGAAAPAEIDGWDDHGLGVYGGGDGGFDDDHPCPIGRAQYGRRRGRQQLGILGRSQGRRRHRDREIRLPVATLGFTTQPGNGVAGSPLSAQPVVEVQDADGNTVASDTSTVTLAIGTNAGGGTLSGTTSQVAVAGVATFTDLSIDAAGDGYTLVAAADGLSQRDQQRLQRQRHGRPAGEAGVYIAAPSSGTAGTPLQRDGAVAGRR